jgi:DNA-binding response OmpR family regulator
MHPGERILLIEDDRDIAAVVSSNLRDEGYRVEHAADGRSGLDRALRDPPDLVILDLGLPLLDGMDVCRRIRQRDPATPLLMLTARGAEADRVRGLETGADEYVVKPFGMRELVARVKALLRRVRTDRENRPAAEGVPTRIVRGSLVVDPARRMASLSGRTVDLTAKEFDLLALFAASPGRAWTRSELLERLWPGEYEGGGHTVNSHINRLRAKIEADPARPRFIETVWGVGYRFSDPRGAGA